MTAPTQYQLQIQLLSDATLGRGDGVAGLVDAEVQHDELGLPYLGGKTLKGLLGAECAEILFSLARSRPAQFEAWRQAADGLFGAPGSRGEAGQVYLGDARPPAALRAALARELHAAEWQILQDFPTPDEAIQKIEALRGQFQRDNLETFTGLRRQTAVDARSGAPLKDTLRTMRVVLRETSFEADLICRAPLTPRQQGLLAACVLAFRRAGTGRNRGRGRLRAEILTADAQPLTAAWFEGFQQEVLS